MGCGSSTPAASHEADAPMAQPPATKDQPQQPQAQQQQKQAQAEPAAAAAPPAAEKAAPAEAAPAPKEAAPMPTHEATEAAAPAEQAVAVAEPMKAEEPAPAAAPAAATVPAAESAPAEASPAEAAPAAAAQAEDDSKSNAPTEVQPSPETPAEVAFHKQPAASPPPPEAEAGSGALPTETVLAVVSADAAPAEPIVAIEPALQPEVQPAAAAAAEEPVKPEEQSQPVEAAAPVSVQEAAPVEVTPVEAVVADAAAPAEEPKAVEATPAAAETASSDATAPATEAAPVDAQSLPAVKPQVVFVLGGPGSGKGTQCARIVSTFNWVHLSAGDLLRKEMKDNEATERGQLIEKIMIEGRIVPAEITVALLLDAIRDNMRKGNTQFLVDGFPRNADNLAAWKSVTRASDLDVQLLFVLFFDCGEEAMRARLLNRGLTSGRVDDESSAIIKRFETYTRDTRPVIQRYASTGRAHRVDAERTLDEVWEDVKRIFAPIDRDTLPMAKIIAAEMAAAEAPPTTTTEVPQVETAAPEPAPVAEAEAPVAAAAEQ